MAITSDRPERTAPGAVWFLDDGPLTVVAIRPPRASRAEP